MQSAVLMRFAEFEVDLDEKQLRREGQLVPITPKVYQVLIYLIENRDRLCQKEELLASIWPDRTVEEANLTQTISVLRKALGESTNGVKHIGTFPGRGYRFLTDVHPEVAVAEPLDAPLFVEPSFGELPPPEPAKVKKRRVPRGVLICLAAIPIIGVIWLKVFPTVARSQALDWKQVALTRVGGAAFEPAVSPDGKSFAFVHERTGGEAREIAVCDWGSPALRVVSQPGADSVSPAWSPDGKSIAYLQASRDSMRVMTVDRETSRTRVLTETFPTRYELTGRHLDWSPDGRLLVVDDKTRPEDPFSLYLVSVSDGRKARLTFPALDVIGDLAPRFSPDGKFVAFVRMIYQNEAELFTIPITGGEAQRLTNDDAVIGDVDWLPDSAGLLFSSVRRGSFGFWRMDSRRPAQRPAPFHPELTSDLPLQFSMARHANALAYASYGPNLNILALDLASKEWMRRVSTWKEESMPEFSPDGKSLAYISNAAGRPQIWVSAADGQGARAITAQSIRPSYYRWSPDSKAIVHTSIGQAGFQIVPIGSPSDIREFPAQCGHPAFSWDGQGVYCQSGVFLTRVSLNGGATQVVTDHGGFPTAMRDADSIYYAGGRIDPNIWRLPLGRGERPTLIISDLLSGYWGCWDVTPEGIYYLALQQNEPWIVFRENSGAIRRVTRFPGRLPPIGVSTISVSQSRKELVVLEAETPISNLVGWVW